MVEPGAVQTDFPREAAGLHVDRGRPARAGLVLHRLSDGVSGASVSGDGESEHLSNGRGYLEFAERCAPQLVGEHFAHKVAWGAAELAEHHRQCRASA